MNLPIIAYDSGDVLVFENKDMAEKYLEPVDIKNNVYVAYDSSGYKLDLSVKGEKVSVCQSTDLKLYAKELKEILFNFFLEIGINQDWCNKASLDELIKKSLEFKTD